MYVALKFVFPNISFPVHCLARGTQSNYQTVYAINTTLRPIIDQIQGIEAQNSYFKATDRLVIGSPQ